jgi:HPt (histidine-containing phosphotransfer) domain-containing protein
MATNITPEREEFLYLLRPRIAANLPGAAMMNGVDLDRLMSLRDDIGPEDFADVVLLFFAEIGETLDRMRADTAPRTADDFHFLRGSAANLGFVEMVRACERAEASCTHGETPDFAAVVRSYEDALTLARSHVPDLSVA